MKQPFHKKHQIRTHVVVLVVRGRPRKAQINDVVSFVSSDEWGIRYGVVVEYRDNVKWNRYHVIRTDPQGARPYGQAIWLDSVVILATGRTAKRPGVVFRHNQRLGGNEVRGCSCNCCHHVAGIEAEPKE